MLHFRPDNFLTRMLTKYFNILVAFILWALCCLPVVTIGASTTAYFSVLMRLSREKDDIQVFSGFFRAFRENFRQATVLWLLAACLSGLAVADLFVFRNVWTEASGIRSTFLAALLLLCILLWTILLYLFPVLARFHVTNRQAIRNAFVMGLRCFPVTLLLTVMIISCVFFLYKWEMFAPFVIVIILYGVAAIFTKIFAPYDGTQQEVTTNAPV